MPDSKDSSKPRIVPAPNGPYLVHGLTKLSNSKGDTLETKATIALCRCGRSSNKPYCDGTHAQVGFDSQKQTDGKKDKRDNYTAGNLTVHDNRGICAHAGFCTDGLPEVFRLKQEPWIVPSAAKAEDIVAAVKRCPSGALSYSQDGVEHKAEGEPAVFVAKNGPYAVTGVELEVEEWGEGASREHYTLCRCGGSKNKPFCDGTHWQGFEDEKN